MLCINKLKQLNIFDQLSELKDLKNNGYVFSNYLQIILILDLLFQNLLLKNTMPI
jgi:hypothetical protein